MAASKVFSVSYDLTAPGRNYKGLSDALCSFPLWWHYLESTWLIAGAQSAEEVSRRLEPHLDRNDRILVCEITPDYWGWLPREAWTWIEEHVGTTGPATTARSA